MTKNWLQSRLISLIKPEEMSNAEYTLKCNINSVNPSVDDYLFMEWIIDEAYSNFNSDLHQKVRDLLIKGLKQHLILDFTDEKWNNYIISFLPNLVLREKLTKDETEKFFRVILEEYRDTPAGKVAYKLNKAFGLTKMCYFKDGVDGLDLHVF